MNETNSRSIGKGYGFYFPIAMGLLGFGIVVYIVVSLFNWTKWKLTLENVWWVVVLPPFAFGFYIFLFAMLLKNGDDKKTKARHEAVHQTCKRINK